MRKYEALFVFPAQQGPDTMKEEDKKVEEAISRFGGKTLDRQDWGQRQLGWPVAKSREARLVLCNFEMDPLRVHEFRKALQLDEKILKVTLSKIPVPKPVKERKRKPKEAVRGRQP